MAEVKTEFTTDYHRGTMIRIVQLVQATLGTAALCRKQVSLQDILDLLNELGANLVEVASFLHKEGQIANGNSGEAISYLTNR